MREKSNEVLRVLQRQLCNTMECSKERLQYGRKSIVASSSGVPHELRSMNVRAEANTEQTFVPVVVASNRFAKRA